MPPLRTLAHVAVLSALAASLGGCMAMAVGGAVAGTAVGVAGAAVGVTAKGVGMAAGAVIPGKDDDKDEDRRR